MKKFVFGCGLVVLVLAILGGAGAYYFVYRPARAFVTSMAQLGEVVDLDKQVANRQAFAAPGDGTLTAAHVQRFVAVQETISTRLGARTSEFEAKYKALGESDQSRSISEVVGAYKDLLGIIVEAKRAQVDGLNAQRFSIDEYTWVKHRFYEAGGVALTGVDFRELASQLQEGKVDALKEAANAGAKAATTDTPGVGIPDASRALVAPYKDKLQGWILFGAFGL